MSNYLSRTTVTVGNLFVAILAVVWAYASYMYNWLNVGGGVGDVDFWDSLSGAVPYMALASWVCLMRVTFSLRSKLSSSASIRTLACCASVAVAPMLLVAADWFFHRGFPKPPV
jgi:hypothetical protein